MSVKIIHGKHLEQSLTWQEKKKKPEGVRQMEAVVDRIMIPQMQQSPPLPRPGPVMLGGELCRYDGVKDLEITRLS